MTMNPNQKCQIMTSQNFSSIPRPLSAKYECDFAYPTVKDRMPVILTKAIDTVYRMKTEILAQVDQDGLEDLKTMVGRMSKLRNEMQTDKPLLMIEDGRSDQQMWNSYLKLEEEQQKAAGDRTGWFRSPWLYTECYMYRRIQEAMTLGVNIIKNLDPFGEQKRNAFMKSELAIEQLAVHLQNALQGLKGKTLQDMQELKLPFVQFVKVALWGNKCDLSISAGAENSQTDDPVNQLEGLESFLLVDDSDQLWDQLMVAHDHHKQNNDCLRVDIVLDNAGFELFTDLCLMELILDTGLVDKVHLHAKAIPWFVSDVTPTDFEWTLSQMEMSDKTVLATLAKTWRQRINDGTVVFDHHDFWTLPYDFSCMKMVSPDLYANLRQAALIFFKGDLNYRKLVSDRRWSGHVPFEFALRGFHPAPVCALRTLKCDVVTGLAEGQAEAMDQKVPNWMIPGDYAVLQVCSVRDSQ